MALALFLQGCVSYPVRFSGYLNSQAPQAGLASHGQTFYITGDKTAGNQLLSAEIGDKISRLLQDKGYRPAARELADLHITYTYAISPGVISGVRPEMQTPGTATVHTFTENGTTRTSYITYPNYTAYVPYRYTVYTANLQLQVLDAHGTQGGKEPRPLWIGESSLTSQNPDLREVVNYLLVGTFEHFGENTGKNIVTSFTSNDPRIKRLAR